MNILGIFGKIVIAGGTYFFKQEAKKKPLMKIKDNLGLLEGKQDFESIYYRAIRTLTDRHSADKKDLINLFYEEDVISEFKIATDLKSVHKILDRLLHTSPNISINSINKNLDNYPFELVFEFSEMFNSAVAKTRTPEIKQLGENMKKEFKELSERMNQQYKFPGYRSIDGEFFLPATDNETLLDAYEMQRKNAVEVGENGNIELSCTQLTKLLAKIENKSNKKLLFKTLTSIGVMHNRNNDDNTAQEYLCRALKVDSENEIALNNYVNALIATSNYQEAEKYVKITLIHFPESIQGWAAKIRLQKNAAKLISIVENIPEPIKKNPQVIAAIGIRWRNFRNYDKSLEYILMGHEIAREDVFIKMQLLSTIVEKYSNDFQLTNLRIIPDAKRLDLEKAQSIISQLESLYPKEFGKKSYVDMLRNKSLITNLLGNNQGALDILNDALKIDDGNVGILQIKASLLLLMDEKNKAFQLLKELWTKDHLPDTAWMYADLCHKNGNTDLAVEVLEKELSNLEESEQKDICKGYLIEILISAERHDRLRMILKEVEVSNNTIDIIFSVRIQQFIEPESKCDPRRIIQEAKNIQKVTSIRTRYLLAERLISLSEYEAAIIVYESFVDKNENHEVTIELAKLYYTVGNKYKSLEIFQNLRRKNGIMADNTSLELLIYLEYGLYKEVREVAHDHLKQFHDPYIQILLNGANIRLGNIREAKASVKKELTIEALDQSTIEQYLGQLVFFKKYNKCRELIFSYTLDKQELYIKWMLMFPILGVGLENITKVKAETLVLLINPSNESVKWLITGNEDTDQSKFILNIADELFSIFKDKYVGDFICFPKSNSKWKIDSIKSKYQYRFEQCILSLSQIPGEEIKIIDSASQILEEFPVKADSEGNDRTDMGQELYANFRLPFCTIVESFNEDYIDLLQRFRKNPNIGIRANQGINEETDIALNILSQPQRLFADASSLFTIFELNLGDLVIQKWGQIRIGVLTYDLFFKHYVDLMRWENTDNSYIDRMTSIIGWLNKYTTQLNSQSYLMEQVPVLSEKIESFGPANVELLYLLNENQGILITDDYVFGQIAQNEYQIKTVWTSALTLHLKNDDLISNHDFTDLTIKLVENNYYHTSISRLVLDRALTKNQNGTLDYFKKCLRYLHGNISNLETSCMVGLDFVFSLHQNEELSNQQKWTITQMVYTALATENVLIDFLIFLNANISSNKKMAREPYQYIILDRMEKHFQEWKIAFGVDDVKLNRF